MVYRFGAAFWLLAIWGVGCGEVAEEKSHLSAALSSDDDAGLPSGVEPPKGNPLPVEDAPEEPQGYGALGPQLGFGDPSDAAATIPGYVPGTAIQFVPDEANAAFVFDQSIKRLAKRASDVHAPTVVGRYLRPESTPVSLNWS